MKSRVGGRPVEGARASANDGMPTVKKAASDRWRGSSGYAAPASPTVRISVAANADLTTNSFATRRMFEQDPPALGDALAGSSRKSSETSTMSDTPRAICEPPPSAIAMRAAFIAGTSLTPSPTIAT